MKTKQQIADELRRCGPVFYEDEKHIDEIAAEWAEDFTAAEASDWMDVGFWCPLTAAAVRALGIEPQEVAELCDHIRGYDPVYAMCNNDLSIFALRDNGRWGPAERQ